MADNCWDCVHPVHDEMCHCDCNAQIPYAERPPYHCGVKCPWTGPGDCPQRHWCPWCGDCEYCYDPGPHSWD